MTIGPQQQLTTHVLDIVSGVPAAGMRIELTSLDRNPPMSPRTYVTNRDGRTDGPLLQGDELTPGGYRLTFHLAEYFQKQGIAHAGRFFRQVPIDFWIEEGGSKYHVPLLASPWSYSTYRGS